MSCVKVAISLDEDLLAKVDDLAREQGLSRSRVIARLIARAAKEAADRAITARLNVVHAKPGARAHQLKMAAEVYGGEVFGDDSQW